MPRVNQRDARLLVVDDEPIVRDLDIFDAFMTLLPEMRAIAQAVTDDCTDNAVLCFTTDMLPACTAAVG